MQPIVFLKAQPKAEKPDLDPHPNVIGKCEEGEEGAIKFDGKEYHPSGRSGASQHDGTEVDEYEHPESGHRVWKDAKGRVHADSKAEAKKRRAK